MRIFEWWVDKEELKWILNKCKKETLSITDYLKETFHLESPCHVVLRPIKEGV